MVLPRDMLRQIRRLQFRAQRLVENLVGGEYHSVYKGRGMAFDEVREYQPGDEVRTIDWNVTARMGHPFIKRFVEERELTVLLVMDVSASQRFSTCALQKRDIAAELAAVLAFSAVVNNDRVGLIAFTDRVEKFVPPRKGVRHVLRLIREVLYFEPSRRGTRLREALDYLNRVIKRRAIVFLLSDFLDRGYEAAFRRTGARHDLVALRISDPAEARLVPAGLVRAKDAETGSSIVVDSGSRTVRRCYAAAAAARDEELGGLARAAGVDLVEISTRGDHLDALVRFFRLRERRLRRT